MEKPIPGTILGLCLLATGSASAMPRYEAYYVFAARGGVSDDDERRYVRLIPVSEDWPVPVGTLRSRCYGTFPAAR